MREIKNLHGPTTTTMQDEAAEKEGCSFACEDPSTQKMAAHLAHLLDQEVVETRSVVVPQKREAEVVPQKREAEVV